MKSNSLSLLFSATYVVAAVAKGGGTVQCNHGVELLYLQDVSSTLENQVLAMAQQMGEAFTTVSSKYVESRFAYSICTDKPMLSLGYGSHDSCGGYGTQDQCYQTVVPMTTDGATIVNALLTTGFTSGKDLFEGQLEGLIRAAQDPSVGWTASHQLDFSKILVFVTDDVHHVAGDAQMAVEDWRVRYGGPSWCAGTMATKECVAACTEAGVLRRAVDEGRATVEEKRRYKIIQTQIGFQDQPDLVAHPGVGVFGNDGCTTYDYPTTEQVAQVVNANKLAVVVLHSGPYGEQQYRDLVELFDVGIFKKMEIGAANVATIIDEAVTEIMAVHCTG